MTLQERLQALATAVANHIRDAVMPRLLPTGGATGQVLAKTAAGNFTTAWASPGAAPWTATTLNLGAVPVFDATLTVLDPTVTAVMPITLKLGLFLDTDDNHAELLDLMGLFVTAIRPGEFDVFLQFMTPQAGIIRLLYQEA